MPPIPKPDIGDIDVEGKEGKSRWSLVSKTPLELDPRLLLLLVRPKPVFIGKSILAMFITGILLVSLSRTGQQAALFSFSFLVLTCFFFKSLIFSI